MSEDKVRKIAEALIAATDHLGYCGYGDSWERECAKAQNLPEQLEAAAAEVYALFPDLANEEVSHN